MPPPERTLRVLWVASESFRIERLQAATDLDLSAASARLEVEQQRRLRFNRHHFNVDPDDPRHYDLTLNTESLGFSGAARIIVEVLTRRFPDREQTPYAVEIPVEHAPFAD